jgi:hypothetical protein
MAAFTLVTTPNIPGRNRQLAMVFAKMTPLTQD